jgi:hypothetical protein
MKDTVTVPVQQKKSLPGTLTREYRLKEYWLE